MAGTVTVAAVVVVVESVGRKGVLKAAVREERLRQGIGLGEEEYTTTMGIVIVAAAGAAAGAIEAVIPQIAESRRIEPVVVVLVPEMGNRQSSAAKVVVAFPVVDILRGAVAIEQESTDCNLYYSSTLVADTEKEAQWRNANEVEKSVESIFGRTA